MRRGLSVKAHQPEEHLTMYLLCALHAAGYNHMTFLDAAGKTGIKVTPASALHQIYK